MKDEWDRRERKDGQGDKEYKTKTRDRVREGHRGETTLVKDQSRARES